MSAWQRWQYTWIHYCLNATNYVFNLSVEFDEGLFYAPGMILSCNTYNLVAFIKRSSPFEDVALGQVKLWYKNWLGIFLPFFLPFNKHFIEREKTLKSTNPRPLTFSNRKTLITQTGLNFRTRTFPKFRNFFILLTFNVSVFFSFLLEKRRGPSNFYSI